MKRILTLLIAVGAFGALHAQTSKEEARRVVLGGGSKNGGSRSQSGRDIILGDGNASDRSYPSSYPSSREGQINRDCDNRIRSIRNNKRLSNAERERSIRRIEKDRARRIRECNDTGSGKHHKSNNGKHKGWSKGKGNKHRYDD